MGFTSWCGGLPAPECADNPLGYKFSWSPRAVLLACLNEAVYLQAGKLVRIPGDHLLEAAQPVRVNAAFAFEGIPNRDSLAYLKPYGLENQVQSMLRGTLRYSGYAELMASLRKLGLLSLQPLADSLRSCSSWAELLAHLLPKQLVSRAALCEKLGLQEGSEQAVRILEAFEWLGLTSPTQSFNPQATLLDSLALLLQSKLQYLPGERDMAFMQHQFHLQSKSGHDSKKIHSTMIVYGDSQYSAMARTVGLPVAMAAEMILRGEYHEPGIQRPLQAKLYNRLLDRLESHGMRFKEE